jgi:hypothetical protein
MSDLEVVHNFELREKDWIDLEVDLVKVFIHLDRKLTLKNVAEAIQVKSARVLRKILNFEQLTLSMFKLLLIVKIHEKYLPELHSKVFIAPMTAAKFEEKYQHHFQGMIVPTIIEPKKVVKKRKIKRKRKTKKTVTTVKNPSQQVGKNTGSVSQIVTP